MTSLDNQESGLTLPLFIGLAVLVIVGAGAAIWFALPGPDTDLRLVSPSGRSALELGELCSEVACNRVAILELEGVRTGCPLQLPGSVPLLGSVAATWSEDESAVSVAYGVPPGQTGTLEFSAQTCTLTR